MDEKTTKKERIFQKLTSRKFWVCVASFLASVATTIAGFNIESEAIIVVGAICTVVSAGIFAAVEAACDIADIDEEILDEILDSEDDGDDKEEAA